MNGAPNSWDPEVLDAAIEETARDAAAARPGDPRQLGIQLRLAELEAHRFHLSSDSDGLRRARQHAEAALTAADAPGVPPEARGQSMVLLATILAVAHKIWGKASDRDWAIRLLEEAQIHPGSGGPTYADPLGMPGATLTLVLTDMLVHRWRMTGTDADLDRAVDIARRAVASDVPDAADLEALGTTLILQHERDADPALLAESVQALGRAFDLMPPDHPGKVRVLAEGCQSMRLLAMATGDSAPLDQAIGLMETALERISDGHPFRVRLLVQSMTCLLIRRDLVGGETDLDRGLERMRLAVSLTHLGPGYLAEAMLQTGIVCRMTSEARRDLLLLSEAIDWFGKAVEIAEGAGGDLPAGSAARHQRARALLARFRVQGNGSDLDEAVAEAARVVTHAGTGEIDRPAALLGLAEGLSERFGARGAAKDLDEAIAKARDALGCSSGTQYGGSASWTLALLLMRRHDSEYGYAAIRPGSSDVVEALELAYKADPVMRGDLGGRLDALALSGSLHARLGAWAEAARDREEALALVPLAVSLRVDRADRGQRLIRFQGLAAAAAHTYLEAGLPDRALEVLERGRGVVFAQELALSEAAARLRRPRPDLAAKAAEVRAALVEAPPRHHGLAYEADVARRKAANETWRSLVEEIRAVDGFADFDRPVDFAQVSAVVGDDTIVTLTATPTKGIALIMRGGALETLELPAADVESAVRAATVLAAVTHPENLGDSFDPATLWFPAGWSAETDGLIWPLDSAEIVSRCVSVILTWAWRAVVRPVLDRLGHDRTPPAGGTWPRVTWIPCGPFVAFPLHAVGAYLAPEPGGAALDRVISSYAMNLRALLHARRPHEPRVGGPADRLAVGVSRAPGAEPLTGVAQEIRQVVKAHQAEPLLDEAATKSAVLARLPEARTAHFACHGFADAFRPTQAFLLLPDGRLTIGDIIEAGGTDADLAYLSACSTGAAGAVLADEGLTLAAAMQVAGFRHVVSTLWPVPDLLARLVAGHFYRELAKGADPAASLHAAVRECRDGFGYPVSDYSCFTHHGPGSADAASAPQHG